MYGSSPIEKAVTTGPVEAEYDLVSQVCAYIVQHWQNQPGLEEISRAVGYSPAHLQKAFANWAGISPKDFLAAVNIQKARVMLEEGATLLDTSHALGLSGPSRLHDLFITKEAMTPGAYKNRGAGLRLSYGLCDTIFGICLMMTHGGAIAGLSFCDPHTKEQVFEDMRKRWPKAEYIEAQDEITQKAGQLFPKAAQDQPIKLVLIGSDFDISVWEALTYIPAGCLVSYSDIAEKIGKPKAVRAVASSVGRNPISFYVPCHRVLRRGGLLGGYHWGLARKCALIGWENTPQK